MTDPNYAAGAPGNGPSAPPGWYPDQVNGGQRWWDGTAWGPYAPPEPRQLPFYPDARTATASEERTWATWSHLGPLLMGVVAMLVTGGALSILTFVFPLIVMNTVGSRSARVRAHAVESLNFQLSMLLYSVTLTIVMLVVAVATIGLGLIVMIPALIALGLFWVVVMVIASVQASNGGFYRYPLNIRFVR